MDVCGRSNLRDRARDATLTEVWKSLGALVQTESQDVESTVVNELFTGAHILDVSCRPFVTNKLDSRFYHAGNIRPVPERASAKKASEARRARLGTFTSDESSLFFRLPTLKMVVNRRQFILR
jgi:hypothetical protein